MHTIPAHLRAPITTCACASRWEPLKFAKRTYTIRARADAEKGPRHTISESHECRSLRLSIAEVEALTVRRRTTWPVDPSREGRGFARWIADDRERPGTHLGAAVRTSSVCHAKRERSLARHFRLRGRRHARPSGRAFTCVDGWEEEKKGSSLALFDERGPPRRAGSAIYREPKRRTPARHRTEADARTTPQWHVIA